MIVPKLIESFLVDLLEFDPSSSGVKSLSPQSKKTEKDWRDSRVSVGVQANFMENSLVAEEAAVKSDLDEITYILVGQEQGSKAKVSIDALVAQSTFELIFETPVNG